MVQFVRNTTKLKILLKKYTVSHDMNDDESFVLLLTDKATTKCMLMKSFKILRQGEKNNSCYCN